MEENIKGRNLSEEEVKELMQTSDDITLELLKDFFAYRKTKKPKYSPQDYFVLPANKLYNEKAISTKVGRYIFNKFILNDKIGPMIGYRNYAFDDKAISKLEQTFSDLYLEKKIDQNDIFEFINKLNWFTFSISYFINPSLDTDFVITNPKVSNRKNELIKENDVEIENCNVKVVGDIEKELINMAKDIYKDHPSMQIYSSGCRGSFGNNYKNCSIMRGVVTDFVDPSKVSISTSNLDEGFTPKDFKGYCDLSIAGTYGKAIETQKGEKKRHIFVIVNQTSLIFVKM